jgi:hypothetical protein
MRIGRIVVLVSLLVPSLATAAPILINDGGTYDIGTPTGDSYSVYNGTLNLLPGAEVSSVSGTGNPAAIHMSGGSVSNGIVIAAGADLTVSGGESRGSDYGRNGLLVYDATANITGGTFVGADGPGQAGSGVVGLAGDGSGVPVVWSTLNISGGTFQGGTGSGGYYGGTTGYSLLSLGDTTVTGGRFLSPIAIITSYGGVTDFLGTNLSYHDYILSGTLQNGDPIDVRVYPGIPDASVSVLAAAGLALRRSRRGL